MTKIVIISDNHFQKKEFDGIVTRHADADYFVHCGDSQWQPDDHFIQNFIIVRGNNDFVDFPNDVVFEVQDKKILVTHGHNQYVSNYGDGTDNIKGTENLVTYALDKYQANIVLYGHTHVPEMHMDRDVLVVNPGSTNFPRGFVNRVPAYAVMTIIDGIVAVFFYQAKNHTPLAIKGSAFTK